MSNDFKIVIPAQLEKSSDGEWKVAGLASTESFDLQNEKIIQTGIDLSPIEQGKGFFNWDHDNSPESIIGEIDGYKKDSRGLFVHGKLFKNHSKAKAVYEIMSSLSENKKGAMGFSVEGQILERDPNNPSIIKKCRIKNVALTMNPVNPNTYASLLKSLTATQFEFDSTGENKSEENQVNNEAPVFTANQVLSIIEKALSIGSGYTQAPNQLSGGAALATSSMNSEKDEDSKKKKKKDEKEDMEVKKSDTCKCGENCACSDCSCTTPKFLLKSMTKDLYKSNMENMLSTLQTLYPQYSREAIWGAVKDRFNTIFPEVTKKDLV